MQTVELQLLGTLALATGLFFVGQWLVRRSTLLQRYSMPVPVVAGVLFACAMAAAGQFTGLRLVVDESPRDPLLLAFFATLGLGADVRSLATGGRKLIMLVALFFSLMVIQSAIGLGMARLFDMHPLLGLLAGSISLVGGHGTAAAYSANFAAKHNIQGALELGMAAATVGLILGSMLAGPVAERLMQRAARTTAEPVTPAQAAAPESDVLMPIEAEQLLFVLLVCLLCIGGAHWMHTLLTDTGILLPDFLWALILGMLVRNVLGPVAFRLGVSKPINDRAVQAVGSVALSLFLIIALMSMRILDLATTAGPLLLIVLTNALATAAFAYFITARVMGGDYEAAVISGGQVAAALATTAVGMSVMQTLAERHGPAPFAFLLIPIVGAFFADFANALVVQGFVALPVLGF